ncbi:MAG: phage major capsid protein [Smithellaceae bacterium]|jgi:HK97 family phage major capsid protein
MTELEEAKAKIDELNRNVVTLRDKYDLMEKGVITADAFKRFQDQINPQIQALNIAIQRPAGVVSPGGGTTDKNSEGAAEYKKAFFNCLRNGRLNLNEKAAAYVTERKALVGDATGDILIPEALESEIYRSLPKLNVLRGLATVRNMAVGDRIRRRSLTEVQVGWGKLEIGGTPPETTQVPGELWDYVEDLNGLAKIGEDELMDSDQNLEPVIADSFSRAIAEAEETAFMNGTGHTFQQPQGFTLTASGITRVTNTAAGAVTIEDFLALKYAVPAQYRQNGTFVMNSGTELLLALLRATYTGGSGAFLWQPTVAAGTPNMLCGHPTAICDAMAEVGDGALQDIALFGDIRAAYRILDRKGMTLKRMSEVYATAGLIGLLVKKRVTGSVVRPDAVRIMQEHS